MATAGDTTTIGRTVRIRGRVTGTADLEIEGYVEGEVTLEGELTIGESGRVGANVRARTVIVRGAVRGDLQADDVIRLEATARVVGDVRAPRVSIAPGAKVRGFVQTAGSGGAAPRAAATRAASHQQREERGSAGDQLQRGHQHRSPRGSGRRAGSGSGPRRGAAGASSHLGARADHQASGDSGRARSVTPRRAAGTGRPGDQEGEGAAHQEARRMSLPEMSADERRSRLLALLTERSFARRKVILASGKESDFFIDCKQTVLTAEGHTLVGELMADALAQLPRAVAVAGVELGGCPLASAVSLTSFRRGDAKDALYVRKAAKDHGSQRLVEGNTRPAPGRAGRRAGRRRDHGRFDAARHRDSLGRRVPRRRRDRAGRPPRGGRRGHPRDRGTARCIVHARGLPPARAGSHHRYAGRAGRSALISPARS